MCIPNSNLLITVLLQDVMKELYFSKNSFNNKYSQLGSLPAQMLVQVFAQKILAPE